MKCFICEKEITNEDLKDKTKLKIKKSRFIKNNYHENCLTEHLKKEFPGLYKIIVNK